LACSNFAEFGEQLRDAARRRVVSLDLSRPTTLGSVLGEPLLQAQPLAQSRSVLGGGEELGAGSDTFNPVWPSRTCLMASNLPPAGHTLTSVDTGSGVATPFPV
jgi:hypothetical protein